MTRYSLLIDLHSWRGNNETFERQRATNHLQGTGLGGSLKHGLEPDPDSAPPTKATHAHADNPPDHAPLYPPPEGHADADSNAHPDPCDDAYQLIVEKGLLGWCNSGARHCGSSYPSVTIISHLNISCYFTGPRTRLDRHPNRAPTGISA